MTTKLLHISDIHLGNSQYNTNGMRRQDLADAFQAAINIAIDEDVDAIVSTGDLFESPSPNLEDLSTCLDVLRTLEGTNIPFYGIVGDHERKFEIQWMDFFQDINTHCERLGTQNPVVLNDEVELFGVDAVRRPEWNTTNFTLNITNENHTSILCMHELFEELLNSEYYTKTQSLDDVFSRVNQKPDLMLLGDYHGTLDDLYDDVRVTYAGSTERNSVKEQDTRTVNLVTIDNSNVDVNTIPVEEGGVENTPRPFRRLEMHLESGDSETQVLEKVKNTYSEELRDNLFLSLVLSGDNTIVSSTSIKRTIEEQLNIPIVVVTDNREMLEIDESMQDIGEARNIEDALDEKVEETVESETIKQVERVVRDKDETAKNSIRNKVRDTLEEGDN